MNQETINLLEKIKRIKALAENGIGGEKESAQAMLGRLMKKFNISESEISEEVIEEAYFNYKDDCEKKLLLQIFYTVTGKTKYWNIKDKRYKKVGVDCTKVEKIEIEASYEFFKRAMEEELKTFYMAFFSKNELFPDDHKNDNREMTSADLKALMMMKGMEKHNKLKQIGAVN